MRTICQSYLLEPGYLIHLGLDHFDLLLCNGRVLANLRQDLDGTLINNNTSIILQSIYLNTMASGRPLAVSTCLLALYQHAKITYVYHTNVPEYTGVLKEIKKRFHFVLRFC